MSATPISSDAPLPGQLHPATPVELPCPMCEYNLHGLSEPRCPECGYRFEWRVLLDAAQRTHPYIFEHHAKRFIWSFWKTAWNHLVGPGTFWLTLKPVQLSRPGRLRVYWLLTILIVASPVLGEWLVVATSLAASGTGLVGSWGTTRVPGNLWTNFVNMDPAPWSLEFGRALFHYDPFFASATGMLFCAVGWPVLTYLSLLVFQQTMRRVKVRPIHALRCVLYSADVFIWTTPVYILFGLLSVLGGSFDVRNMVANATPLALFVAESLLVIRLAFAYARYMQFDHPVATIVASQIIALLAGLAILVNVVN